MSAIRPLQVSRRDSRAGPAMIGMPSALAHLLSGATIWLVPLILIAIWWLGSAHGWINAQTLPPPKQVLGTLIEMIRDGEAWDNLSISLRRVFSGFLLGTIVGGALGLAMGLSRTIRELLYPSFKAIACVPVLGWLPLFMLFLGIGEALKVVLIAKAALVPVAINTCQGIKGVPSAYLEVGKVYRLGYRQTLVRVMLPAALPSIWSGIRYGLTSCWLVLVMVELLGASEGLGYLMSNGQQLMQMDVLLAAVIIAGLIGFVLDRGLQAVENHLLRWRQAGGGRA
ncbi:MAG: ABC transporter permease [Pseudoxanthomonas sp.]